MKTTHWLVLIIAAILSILLEGCTTRGVTSLPGSSPTIIPATQLPADIMGLIKGQTPSYLGITPGVSRRSDVIAQWGEPNIVRAYENYESLHYFDSEREYILVKQGIVQAVTSRALRGRMVRDGHPATLDDFSQILGAPEVITPTFGGNTWVFPNHGVAVSLHAYQIFVPMNFPSYEMLWGDYPLDYDPFPLIPSIESAGIRPGETTRQQVAHLLGNPDQIVFQDTNAPWWYDVEPSMLGRLRISFSADDIVKYMFITPFDQVPHLLYLEDVVNRYGQPDVLQFLPGEDGIEYATLGLVYLDQGFRVATRCATPTCEAVRRDAIVEQKWYFPPTTLTGYQIMFDPNVAYAEWYGFDE